MPNTTNYDRGAVVLLPFPFSDQTSTKVRPAVVASCEHPSTDLIVVAISSERGVLRPGECSLRSWREAGLLHPSFLKRAITTVDKSLVRRRLGNLQFEDLAELDKALRLWLAI